MCRCRKCRKYEKENDSVSKHHEEKQDKELCCDAINKALGEALIGVAELSSSAVETLNENFPVGEPQRLGRVVLVNNSINEVTNAIRDAFASLQNLPCKNAQCCISASFALRDLALAYTSFVITLGATNALPTVDAAQQAINVTLGNLQQSIQLILNNVECKRC